MTNCADNLRLDELLRYREHLRAEAETVLEAGIMLRGVEALLAERKGGRDVRIPERSLNFRRPDANPTVEP